MIYAHNEVSPRQQTCLDHMVGVIQFFADAGYFQSAHLLFKGEKSWLNTVVDMSGHAIRSYSPATHPMDEEPPWNLRMRILLATPLPLGLLLRMTRASAADVVMSGHLIPTLSPLR